MNFQKYYEESRKCGFVPFIECSQDDCYGDMFATNSIINPTHSLDQSVRGFLLESVSPELLIYNVEHRGATDNNSNEEWNLKFIDDLALENKSKSRKIKLVDESFPAKGLWLEYDNSRFLERLNFRIYPGNIQKLLSEISDLHLTEDELSRVIEFAEEMVGDFDSDEGPAPTSLDEWMQLTYLSDECEISDEKINTIKMHLIKPILDTYQSYSYFEAAPDTTYYCVHRAYHWPVLAGVTSNRTYELTAFHCCN